MSTIPSTPKKAYDPVRINADIESIYENLQDKWDLGLRTKTVQDSPAGRLSRAKTEEAKIKHEIEAKIKFIHFQDKESTILPEVIRSFAADGQRLYNGWVRKRHGDPSLIPPTRRDGPVMVIEEERIKLLECLRGILSTRFDLLRSKSRPATPSSARLGPTSASATNAARSVRRQAPNDEPIPIGISTERKNGKRHLDSFENIKKDFGVKKVSSLEFSPAHKNLQTRHQPRNIMQPSPYTRTEQTYTKVPEREISPARQDVRPSRYPQLETEWTYQEPESGTGPARHGVRSSLYPRLETQPPYQPPKHFIESFATTTTVESGIFSQDLTQPIHTQDTEPDLSPRLPKRAEPTFQVDEPLVGGGEAITQSTEDWGSSFNPDDVEALLRAAEEEPRQDVKKNTLREYLDEMLDQASLPAHLESAPLRIIYEITRVFLFTDVPLSRFPPTDRSNWEVYEELWAFLKALPVLQGKKFPEKCSKEAWEASKDGFRKDRCEVVFAATLRVAKTGPPFSVCLQPLRLDRSHRLGRRYGSDRFLELEVPDFEGRRLPKAARDLDPDSWTTFMHWLVDGFKLVGREWKAFFVKVKDERRKSQSLKFEPSDADSAKPYRVSLFAVDGHRFLNQSTRSDGTTSRTKMTIDKLLNDIRPTQENSGQPYMKLFARTALVLSRSYATVPVERSRIKYVEDIKNVDPHDRNKKHVMTDGAGRISLSLAMKVSQDLGLTYIPSAFQGRFGEAKGMWVVMHHDRSGEDWIELYADQCKWKRNDRESPDHESNRTLEVVEYASPLVSAALNTQLLPILTYQATNRRAMMRTIATILENGLRKEVEDLTSAMQSAPGLRAYLNLSKAAMGDRQRTGAVPHTAALPSRTDDRLLMFLDAGFNTNLHQMKMWSKRLFMNRCEELKEKLSIKVGKSTYAYMIPDTWGVLEADEVYLDLSGFEDHISGSIGNNTYLDEVDVLVARNPAHYHSDVQKVRAVTKKELMGLKQVIVFSTKGTPSLAEKLSGGDYDGDKAWVCWDSELVNNFHNADVPDVPDLVKENFIKKDSTKYSDLRIGQNDPTATFLRKSFEFNMRQSMLGMATSWKDKVAYQLRDLSRKELVFLSTLLSNLVDQAKQGFVFTEEDFQRVKKSITNTTGSIKTPHYKMGHIPENPDHILDYIVQKTDSTVDEMLTKFHQSMTTVNFDSDLAKLYKEKSREKDGEWKIILADLKEDLKTKVQIPWRDYWSKRSKGKGKESNDMDSLREFNPICDECFEAYQAIKPHGDNILTRALLNSSPDPDHTQWELLKASTFYALYEKPYNQPEVSNLPWWMAGKQFARLKAERKSMIPVASQIYVGLKMNAAYVKQMQATGRQFPASSQMEGVALGEESDDEFLYED